MKTFEDFHGGSEPQLYLLYQTDEHHSHASKLLIGVFDEKHKAVRGASEFDGYNLSEESLDELENIDQTQGLDTNYTIETRVLNEIGE